MLPSMERVNNVINLKDKTGRRIDIFNLYGVLHVGNLEGSRWDLIDGKFTHFASHSLGFGIHEFEDCKYDDEIRERFNELLRKALSERLL